MKIIVPALLALSFPIATLAAPAKAPLAAKSQIDARGVAALDKAVAYYKKQKSFSVSATETVMAGKTPYRRARIEASLQMPYRATLKITEIDANGKAVQPLTSRLLGAKNYVVSQLELPAQTTAISNSIAAREEATAQMFGVDPSIALAIVVMANGENPASDAYIKSVRYGEIREGRRILKNVRVARKGPNDATPIVAEFRLSPQTYAVEKVVLRGQGAGGDFTVVTQFGPLQPNWRGSQSATDAAVYSWKKFEPRIAIEAARPKAVVQIDPKARALFARAVELYSALDGLRVAYNVTEKGEYSWNDGEKTEASFSFDRAGRVRIAGADVFETLKVIDGKYQWTLDESRANEADEVRYTRETLDEGSAASDSLTALELSFGVAGAFYSLLDQTNPLSAEEVAAQTEGLELREFRASLLSPQPFGGQPCERVRITTRGRTTEQKTYWFARADGRLMRYQEREVQGKSEITANDFQITAQEFNPQFAPDSFKFTPPKGAKLETD